MRKRHAFAGSLIAVFLGAGCGASVPLDTEPAGSGGVSGGSGSGGATAATTTPLDPSPSNVVPSTGGMTGATGGNGGVPGGMGGTAGLAGPTACTPIAVSWQTSTVSLKASAFWIVADGKCYTSSSAKVAVHSDPGWSTYTTLELVWTENNREMRYFIYFTADGNGWWSDEMRTYNEQQPYSDWLYYDGKFFQSPIGQAFTGNLDLTNDPADTIRGELHLHGLTLSTTLMGN